MDLAKIGQFVSQSVRFSYRMLLGYFWDNLKTEDRRAEDNEMHKAEVAELRKSIEANTSAINSLCQHLGGGHNE